MWGVRGRALSNPRPLVFWCVRPGPTTHWLWVRESLAWGPVTHPTARALASWLGALWGQHERARGGRLLPGCGASGVGRSPTPDRSSFGACGRGPLPTGCGCGGYGHGDPSPTPSCALLRAGFARWADGTRAPGGRLLPVCRASGVGRSPTPDRSSVGACGRGLLPLAVGAKGVGVGTRHQPQRARSCELALRAVRTARGRPGGALCLCVGRPGSGALPPPTARPLGRAAGARCHWLWVRRRWVWGHVTNPTARALASWLCTQCGRHESARGGRLLPVYGASGVGRSSTPDCLSFGACGRGTLPLAAGAGGVGVVSCHQPERARSCELALHAVGAARGRPGGAPLACVWGVRGRALSHPRLLVLWGVRLGPATHWL